MSSVAENVPRGTGGQAFSMSIKTVTNEGKRGGGYNVKQQKRQRGWTDGGRRRCGRKADRVRKDWR